MSQKQTKPPLVIELAGKPFGRWFVLWIDPDSRGRRGGPRWVCKCKCGHQQSVLGVALRQGTSKQCQKCAAKSRARKLVYKPGDKVGEWTVIEYSECDRRYRCRCSCGRIALHLVGNLRRGNTGRCQNCARAKP